MRLLFIRHADPDYENNTLTPKGVSEAEALGEYYRDFVFRKAYCSPLKRAEYTASAFMRRHIGKTFEICDWLTEFEVPVCVPYSERKVIPWDFLPSEFVKEEAFFMGDGYLSDRWLKTGEVESRYRMAAEGLDRILAENGYVRSGRLYRAVAPNRDTLLFFCHFGIMSVLLSHLLHIPFVQLAQHLECQPTGVTTVVTEERQKGIAQFRCLRYSDISHLTARGLAPSFAGRFCETFDGAERH